MLQDARMRWRISRMLEDGSRMPQDGLKDHPGDFSWMMLQDGG